VLRSGAFEAARALHKHLAMETRTENEDLTAIEDLFLEEAKIVTLTGSSRREKSKLAKDLASFLEPAFTFDGQGGVHRVLDPADMDEARAKLAKSLSMRKNETPTDEGLANALADAGHALLLFDASEQLAAPLGELIARLAAEAPSARFLVSSIAPLGLAGERAHAVVPPPPKVLEIGPEARWFVLPDGREVDLGQRMSARRILRHLALTRLAAPEDPSSVEELVRVGWPNDGETLSRSKAKNRVHVALHALRRTGLEGLIVTVDAGYYLDAEVHLIAGDEERRAVA
jgi:hypothetical protein